VIILLLWKASRDFRRIVRGKYGDSNSSNPVANNDDLELARIMAQFGAGSI
jgi:hypothetical protein